MATDTATQFKQFSSLKHELESKKCPDEKTRNLYSHMAKIMDHIVVHCPNQALDKLEEISYLLKQGSSLAIENFLELNKGVTKRWSNAKFKVVLKKVTKKGPGVLSFIWQKGGISFVDRADPFTINLSEHLVNQQLILTIAHEIGHVLGFPDCYHEFYDKRKKQVIYYSLDNEIENLMCTLSLEALVPDHYFNQLQETACPKD